MIYFVLLVSMMISGFVGGTVWKYSRNAGDSVFVAAAYAVLACVSVGTAMLAVLDILGVQR